MDYRFAGVRILIVDDEPDWLEAICRLLELHRAVPRGVTTATEAVAMVAEFLPDVIISDLAMPGLGGLDLIAHVRALPSEKGGRTPAIALTATGVAENRARAFEAGFQRFLSKPVGSSALMDVIADVLGIACEAGRAEPAKPLLDGVRILAVDDEPDARELFALILSDYGADVTTAASASEAMDALQRVHPDVLLSDIRMPEEDGYTLIRKIRELPRERGGGVPAVSVTAHARSEDRIKALLAGFQVHMPKPIDPPELAATIANLAGVGSKR